MRFYNVFLLFCAVRWFPGATSLEYVDPGDVIATTLSLRNGTFVTPDGGWNKESRMFRCIFEDEKSDPPEKKAKSKIQIWYINLQKL